jgi:hypothetical protein
LARPASRREGSTTGCTTKQTAASLRQFPIMDQKDTKLARPLYRFICFSKSNGNAMRLIWMLMNALSRLLNPLNRSSTRPPHDSHPLQSVYRDLTRATGCFQGNPRLQKVASINCLLDGQKICTSWAALDITTKDLLPQHCCQYKRDLTAARSSRKARFHM